MKLCFTPEWVDRQLQFFVDGSLGCVDFTEELNARLAEMLADAPVVYGICETGHWYGQTNPSPVDTHKARLVEIEEIEK